MNTKSNIVYFILVVIVLAQTGLQAQTFSDLYDFDNLYASTTNATQIEPSGDLIISAGVLYGVTYQGGSNSQGGLYSINPDGTDFKALYSFKDSASRRLTLLSGILYAPIFPGSTAGGNIVSVDTNGGPSHVIHQFTGTGEGVFPTGIASAGNMLFGTTMFSNSYSGPGTIYSINTNDDSFTVLHTFNQTQAGQWLTVSGGTLYGAASSDSATASPTNNVLFSIATNGDNYTNLYTFTDGALAGWLIINRGMIYGLGLSNTPPNYAGGSGGYVFSIETNGSNFSVLHVFTISPNGLTLLNDNLLCGASIADGLYNGGTIYSMSTNGSGYNVLYNFPEYRGSGFAGASGLVSDGNTLLGTTQEGGTNEWGSIYSLNLAPTIQSVTSTNGYLNMVWNAASGAYYKTQYSTNISCTNWLDLGGIFTATNQTISIMDPIIGTQRFYRLIYQPSSN